MNDKLVAKVNDIDTNGCRKKINIVQINQIGKRKLVMQTKKIPDTSGLVKKKKQIIMQKLLK